MRFRDGSGMSKKDQGRHMRCGLSVVIDWFPELIRNWICWNSGACLGTIHYKVPLYIVTRSTVGKQLAQLSVWYQLGNISATDSSILACKIPWTEEPGGLQSMGSQRVRYNWAHTHTANSRHWGWWLWGQILCVLRIRRELRTGKHHHVGQIMAA